MKIINLKNLKSLIIIISLFLSFSIINNVSADTQLFDVAEHNRVLVQQYIHRSDDGILVLNSDEAIAAGISEELLGEISQNISEMNAVVTEGKGYIGSDNVLRYRNVGVSFRAAGGTRVESYWWGETRIYISASDTRNSLNALKQTGSAANAVLSWVSVPNYLKSTITNVIGNNINLTQQAVNQGRGLLMIVTNAGGVSLMLN